MEIMFVPIELLEERYSAQWYQWFMADFKKQGITPLVIGDTEPRRITVGQFLDVYETNIYKACQLQEIIRYCQEGWEGTVFFMDLWFPGIEALAYVRDNAKRKIRIEGILHAGTWDPWDFITQNGCQRWAKWIENGWFELSDRIYVATHFHRRLLVRHGCPESKIQVVRFPCYTNEGLRRMRKEDIVVFPHRIALEKKPEDFDIVKDIYQELTGDKKTLFLRTQDECESKRDYYELLARSKIVFSAALQETFGIAMIEAWNLGCVPVAPDRLSYQETLDQWPRYTDLQGAVRLVASHLVNYRMPEVSRYTESTLDIVTRIGR